MKFLAAEEYQPQLQQLFERIAADIRCHLAGVRIEHVGASSVPGAISKGDLDVFVGVERKLFDQTVRILDKLGYSVKQDTLRTESLCMLETDKYGIPVAIQLVENGSEYEMFLTFRDMLRQDEDLLASYNLMKRRCTGVSEESYRTTKAEFIEGVLRSGRTNPSCMK